MDFFYVLDGENGESEWYLPNEFDQVCVCAFVCGCAHVHACVNVCIERSHMESGGDEIMLSRGEVCYNGSEAGKIFIPSPLSELFSVIVIMSV